MYFSDRTIQRFFIQQPPFSIKGAVRWTTPFFYRNGNGRSAQKMQTVTLFHSTPCNTVALHGDFLRQNPFFLIGMYLAGEVIEQRILFFSIKPPLECDFLAPAASLPTPQCISCWRLFLSLHPEENLFDDFPHSRILTGIGNV